MHDIPYMIDHSVTITFESPFWIALFEMNDEKGYSVAREVIGVSEPTGSDISLFFTRLDFDRLAYSTPTLYESDNNSRRAMNYKRMQKKIKREVECREFKYTFTKAQIELKKLHQEKKIQRKCLTKQIDEEKKEWKFQMRQQKRFEKHRGH